jgi:predicted DNA-binding protein YlxM (UPF0122 family)
MKQTVIADLVKTIEYKTGMSMTEIADKIGYSRPFLSRHVNGREEHSDRIEGRLRNEFQDVLKDMYHTTTTTVKARSSNDEKPKDEKLAQLEQRIKSLEEKLELIVVLLKK